MNKTSQSVSPHPDNLTLYSVGTLYNPNRTSWPECNQFNYRCGAAELCLFYDDPTEWEIASIGTAMNRFVLVPYHDVVFFLYQLHEKGGWSEAPYSWWFVPEEQRVVPPTDLPAQTRVLLHICLVNSRNGIIKALGAVTLSPFFTRNLFSEIRRQMTRGWPGDEAYDRQISQANAIWPTPRAMLSGAVARTRGGE